MTDVEGAAIPVDDLVPGENSLDYNKNNLIMRVGIKYPSMKNFRLAIRQYAIKNESDLGIKATDPTRYIEGFAWVGIVLDASMQDQFMLVQLLYSRRRTTIPTTPWVAEKALPILRKKPYCRPNCRMIMDVSLDMTQSGGDNNGH